MELAKDGDEELEKGDAERHLQNSRKATIAVYNEGLNFEALFYETEYRIVLIVGHPCRSLCTDLPLKSSSARGARRDASWQGTPYALVLDGGTCRCDSNRCVCPRLYYGVLVAEERPDSWD